MKSRRGFTPLEAAGLYGRRRGPLTGFTLFELMVVIVIIILVASVSVGLLSVFFRGQSVRQGSMIVTQAFAHAKQMAADKRHVFFIVFENKPEGGQMTIYEDSPTLGNPKSYDPGVDVEVPGRPHFLPQGVWFEPPVSASPGNWLGIEPSGYCRYGWGNDVPSSKFEADLKGNNKSGDIILSMNSPFDTNIKQPYVMCLDIDPAAGKIRKGHFLAK